MITVINRQKTVPIVRSRVHNVLSIILDELDYRGYDVNVVFTSDRTMRWYNKTYRNKDQVTDILSFPFHPDLKPGERIKSLSHDEQALGDLIIAPVYVVRDAATMIDTSFAQRLDVLLVHGVVHLLGYDHMTDQDAAVMEKLEKRLLKAVIKRA